MSILAQINYHAFTEKTQCIVIDDIGEGLDYERSCPLVNLLMAKARKSNAQLIMTTNDRFIMNVVPLKYWILLKCEKGNIQFYNNTNSKKIFNDFKFTGLNNFDFSRLDYVNSETSSDE